MFKRHASLLLALCALALIALVRSGVRVGGRAESAVDGHGVLRSDELLPDSRQHRRLQGACAEHRRRAERRQHGHRHRRPPGRPEGRGAKPNPAVDWQIGHGNELCGLDVHVLGCRRDRRPPRTDDPRRSRGGRNGRRETNLVSVSGGGAPEAVRETPTTISSTPASFGIAPGSTATALSSTQAGAHPDLTTTLAFNTIEQRVCSPGDPKESGVGSAAGVRRRPRRHPEVPDRDVHGNQRARHCPLHCSLSTQVGTVTVLSAAAQCQ